MRTHTIVLRSAAALACLMALPSLQAATVTYDFSVAVMTGPAGGSTAFGHFSYDSASVSAGGGYNSATGLLTDLAFALDGTSYTEATANTGSLGFNSLGDLSSFLSAPTAARALVPSAMASRVSPRTMRALPTPGPASPAFSVAVRPSSPCATAQCPSRLPWRWYWRAGWQPSLRAVRAAEGSARAGLDQSRHR